jgi:4-hydroxybenzoate polyprenyltransferase
LRPKQWTKNLLLFAGYIFTIEQHHPSGTLPRVALAFALFCAVSGSTYIFNDAADAERDRLHPRKCKRPIASGRVPIAVALVFGCLLVGGALWASFRLDSGFGLLAFAYFALTMAYSMSLKHIVIIDVLVLAAGFVIRAVAGAVVIHVMISPWLLACTTLLALFLGIAKRRGEVVNLTNGEACRKTLAEYSVPMLDQMLTISASACLMTYFLYTFTPKSAGGAPHPTPMMITIPFVIYGLFRYLFLIHNSPDGGASPDQLLLEDRPLLMTVILFAVAAMIALKV